VVFRTRHCNCQLQLQIRADRRVSRCSLTFVVLDMHWPRYHTNVHSDAARTDTHTRLLGRLFISLNRLLTRTFKQTRALLIAIQPTRLIITRRWHDVLGPYSSEYEYTVSLSVDLRGRNITAIAEGGLSCWSLGSQGFNDAAGVLLDNNPLGAVPNGSLFMSSQVTGNPHGRWVIFFCCTVLFFHIYR
jgi:hypothetical protein